MLLETFTYHQDIEEVVTQITPLLKAEYGFSKRSIALLLLQRDEEVWEMVRQKEEAGFEQIKSILDRFSHHSESPLFQVSAAQQEWTRSIVNQVVDYKPENRKKLGAFFNSITLNPWTGIPLLLLVLYVGFYQFVGVFGAGTLVDWIETNVFDNFLNVYVNDFFNRIIPNKIFADLIINDYGIFTMGVKYAIAIVLPIVGCFFLMFSIIEDSGYLPRISMLLDRVFKLIGLNGRAVIPMTLGFGCDTMATMVSRTLETRRERIIATFLLSLTIPCSAQLGVILALLSGRPAALLIWVGVMVLVFLLIGYLTSRVLPGEKAGFYMELPPLRLPKFTNVLKKTYTRMYWYFKEVLPLFILASVLIWLGNITGAFQWTIRMLIPVVHQLGLPDSTAEVFLFGFFRRDYGAAGLLDLQGTGTMDGRQLVVAAVTLTLFVPCIAQFAIMIKERGWKTAMAMVAFIIPFAFGAGYLVNKILVALQVTL